MSKKKIEQCLNIIENEGDCGDLHCINCPKTMWCRGMKNGRDDAELRDDRCFWARQYISRRKEKALGVLGCNIVPSGETISVKRENYLTTAKILAGNYTIEVDCNGVTIWDNRTGKWVLDASDILYSGKLNFFDPLTGKHEKIKIMEGSNDES